MALEITWRTPVVYVLRVGYPPQRVDTRPLWRRLLRH